MNIFLPKSAEFILSALKKHGFEGYIVGGCVRDLLLGRTPYDYDITTNALPSEIKSIFKKTIDTGIKHGTVTVVIQNDMVEVTTYRTEKGYSDCRRPDSVNFVSNVKDDLARRDFTVNAICYNPEFGFIDCFGGIDDINNRILRAVGDAEVRFKEDALRILRLFRFSSVLNFSIEKNTYLSALECSSLLENISMERIASELKKLSCGDNVSAISPLIKLGALNFLFLGNTSSVSKIALLPNNDNLRFFAFLNICSTNLKKTLSLLKLSNDFKEYCYNMYELQNVDIKNDRVFIKKLLSLYGYDILKDIFIYKSVIRNENLDAQIKLTQDIIKLNEPYKISSLALDGNDLKNLGIKGKDIGIALKKMLNEVIINPNHNTAEILTEIITKK
ncbi:MAG: CCA tRNA nucleotidyltransferase [Clostridia bacterium]|nr:CCA tRNA nucleotidyltransferase [Clostridia bacterium]